MSNYPYDPVGILFLPRPAQATKSAANAFSTMLDWGGKAWRGTKGTAQTAVRNGLDLSKTKGVGDTIYNAAKAGDMPVLMRHLGRRPDLMNTVMDARRAAPDAADRIFRQVADEAISSGTVGSVRRPWKRFAALGSIPVGYGAYEFGSLKGYGLGAQDGMQEGVGLGANYVTGAMRDKFNNMEFDDRLKASIGTLMGTDNLMDGVEERVFNKDTGLGYVPELYNQARTGMSSGDFKRWAADHFWRAAGAGKLKNAPAITGWFAPSDKPAPTAPWS